MPTTALSAKTRCPAQLFSVLVGVGTAYIPGFDTTTGGNPNYQIGRMPAKHLIARGHRRIAFAHLRDARQDPYGAPP